MKMKTLAVLLMVVITTALGWSQNVPITDTYRLQPEDVIIVQVYRIPEIDAILPVGPDGNISAPFIGIIRAAGKTTRELEYDLTVAYVDRLKLADPIVSVSIREYRPIKASISGVVGRPGVYVMRPGDTIRDLVSAGGGTVTDGRADLRRSYLVKRGSQERIPIDMYALQSGDNTQNYTVEDGDTLTIPEERDNRIVVAGRVRQPGPVIYREGVTLYEVVQQAGEVNRRSRLSRVQVFRKLKGRPGSYLAIEADLVAFQNKGAADQNIQLQPGDFVCVPDSGNLDFEVINSAASLFFILDRVGFNPFRF